MRLDVVVPAYNAATYLAETLDSVFAQEQAHHINTVYVIDDGSSDGTREVLRRYASRVRVLQTDRAGNVGARNAALQESAADLIAFCDADDVWEPAKLSRQIPAFTDPSVVASCTALRQIDPSGRVLTTKGTRWSEATVRQLLVDEFVMPTPLSSWVVRRSVFGQLDSRLPVGADLEMACRVIRAGHVHFVPEPLIRYRVHGQSISAARTAEQQAVRRYLRGNLHSGGRGQTFAEWQQTYQLSGRDRRADAAVYHYRAAGQRLSEGARFRAVGHLIRSCIFDSREFARKLKAVV